MNAYDRCVCEREPNTGLAILAVALGAAGQSMQGRTGKSDAQITIEREMDRVRDICMIEASRGASNGYARRDVEPANHLIVLNAAVWKGMSYVSS